MGSAGFLRVIGIGHRDRADDAVGRLLADRLRERAPPGVEVVDTDGEAARLLDLIAGVDHVVIVDAALSGAGPGTIRRFDAVARPLPRTAFAASTHAVGLADAIELARALDQLPAHCIVYAIEGSSFELGQPLSPAVATAIDETIALVLDEVRVTAV